MKLPIKVNQFEWGNQGRVQEIGTIVREVHQSSYYGPTPNGCCAGFVSKHTYLWVEYMGKKCVIKPTHHWPHFIGPVVPYEITLPGANASVTALRKGA